MAAPTLAPQLHPAFLRILEGIFPQAIQQEFVPVRRTDAPIYCECEMPQYAGERCARIAAVTDLASEIPMCLKHFAGVNQ